MSDNDANKYSGLSNAEALETGENVLKNLAWAARKFSNGEPGSNDLIKEYAADLHAIEEELGRRLKYGPSESYNEGVIYDYNGWENLDAPSCEGVSDEERADREYIQTMERLDALRAEAQSSINVACQFGGAHQIICEDSKIIEGQARRATQYLVKDLAEMRCLLDAGRKMLVPEYAPSTPAEGASGKECGK